MKIETGRAYYVPTQELEDDFLKRAEEQGFLWNSGSKPSEFAYHISSQSTLCICTGKDKNIYFAPMSSALSWSDIAIVEWEIEKLEPKPEIIRLGNLKIVFNGDYTIVTDGRFTGKAKRNPADEYDAVVGLRLAVERCEKARKDYFTNLSAEEIIKEVSGGKVAWKR